MAYSQFTYKKIRTELGLYYDTQLLFDSFPKIQASEWLQKTLLVNKAVALYSEKARSEGIVFPILMEVKQAADLHFAVYSGAILNADETKGLNGECDFLLSSGKQGFDMETALFCVIEAEDNDIEKNIPQCTAQMQGAKIYNLNEQNSVAVIYGCVTTGTEWQFLKLENNICWIDSQRFYINDLPSLLGMLHKILEVQTAK